jgi:hypothetical protein
MPIHNWVPAADVFHDFHQVWSVGIRHALNRGILPAGYSAHVELHAGGLIPDVLALQRRPRAPRSGEAPAGVVTAPPKTRHVIQTRAPGLGGRSSRIAIRHRLGDLVSVIEIVSPGNKASVNGLNSFIDKSIELLEHGVHLLVIDLFPPSERDPQGIHKSGWDEIEESDFTLPPDKPLTLAAYRAGNATAGIATTAYVEPVGVGDAMPDMPVFLESFGHVLVPLEATYQAAFADCPPDMRTLVETGRLPED